MTKTIVSSITNNGSEAKISYRVTELGDPKVEFLCVISTEQSANCFGNIGNGQIQITTATFRLLVGPGGKMFFIKNKMAGASYLSVWGIGKPKPFEMGLCQPF
jgi:hypothetical protein